MGSAFRSITFLTEFFVAKKAKPPDDNQDTSGQVAPKDGDGKETTAGYFRKIFEENPKLLNERSNKKLLKRWLADHTGQTEVPKSVKANLANLKSGWCPTNIAALVPVL
jgi:predicted SnoaL-like aldol condensation-catalyzing enzyme